MTSSKNQTVNRRSSKKAKSSAKVASPAPMPAAAKKALCTGAPILPGEDSRAYRGRLKAWTGSLDPRNAVETYLVERAVVLSWQLDRADRAQLALLADPANANTRDQASDDAIDRATRQLFDLSDSGERLRSYQLACGQALFSTLDAFSNLRGIGPVADGIRDSSPSTSPTPIDGTPPTAAVPPVHGSFSMCAEAGPAQSCHVSAALVEILGSVGSAGDLATPAAPIGMTPATQVRRPDGFTADRGDAARPEGPQAAPDETHGRTAAGPRRRPAIRRVRQAPWSGSGGPQTAGSAPIGLKSSPVRRSMHQPESTPNAPDTRRRVGGYVVPLDPSVPVACADRIPVRLRREASAARHDRSVARPSS